MTKAHIRPVAFVACTVFLTVGFSSHGAEVQKKVSPSQVVRSLSGRTLEEFKTGSATRTAAHNVQTRNDALRKVLPQSRASP